LYIVELQKLCRRESFEDRDAGANNVAETARLVELHIAETSV